jgi:hypothetical protein
MRHLFAVLGKGSDARFNPYSSKKRMKRETPFSQ